MPRYTQPRKTWQYTVDFKVKAVKLSYQEGIQVKQVAEGLDIHPFMLSHGRLMGDGQKRVRVNKEKSTINVQDLSEIDRLKKDNERLRKENDLLKKWQRYLAEQHQNDLDSSKDTENSA